MSFQRYPAYKDSGVEWLGGLPEHWTAIRLKNVLAQRITDGPHLTPVFVPDGVPFLSVDGIQNGELTFDSCRYVSEDDHIEFSKKVRPQRDDVLMGKAASTGKIARVKVDFEFSIWSPLALIRVDHRVALPSFVEYTLKSPQTQAEIDVLCTSNTQKNISMDDIPKLALARPPIEEQAIITEFLDRETAKIDALVAEQEQLITLLKEKRQAVISHAVTKGLDPSVPMKDSGVEWLGEVPAHWEVKTLKLIATVQTGVAKGKDNTGKETVVVPYLRVANVQDGYLALDDLAEIEIPATDLHRYSLRSGDVLMNEGGDFDKLGRGHVWRAEIDPCIHQNHVFAVRPYSVSPEWLNTVTGSSYAQFYFMSRSKQSTNLASISSTSIMELPVVLPPVSEQAHLLSFLDQSTSHLWRLIDEAVLSVDLLRERRSALISAAVTGQIDVRGAG